MSTEAQQREAWIAEAHALGAEHARNAASWAVDGNTKQEAIRYVIGLLDAGDPAIDDYLPAYPNLSGEWADNPTPRSLFQDITGLDAHAEATWNMDAYNALTDELSDAYEAGVSETFYAECERVFRAALDDEAGR